MSIVTLTEIEHRPCAKDASAHALLEDLAFRYGRSYESYLVTEPGRECFWLPDERGVVAYLQRGRYLHVGGGLLAPDDEKPELLKSFTRFADEKRLRVLFYNIPPDETPLFRRAGFQVTKWGEDTIIDLPRLTFEGKAYEWVRRQTSYALRQRLEFEECIPVSLATQEWASLARELLVVAAGILSERPQIGDIGFLNGRFDPWDLGRRRLFLARNTRSRRIEGFLVCNPCVNGDEWALELYRDRPDAVRGTIPFLMHQTLVRLRDEGVPRASLCLVPSVRCETPLPGDSAIIRHAMVISQYFGFIFDVSGLYHFKSRFRPRFEDRFTCARPAVSLGAAISFIRVCGALRLDSIKLLRGLWRHLRYAKARSTLAIPQTESSTLANRSAGRNGTQVGGVASANACSDDVPAVFRSDRSGKNQFGNRLG